MRGKWCAVICLITANQSWISIWRKLSLYWWVSVRCFSLPYFSWIEDSILLFFFFYFFNNIGRTNVILCYQWKIDAFPKSNKKGLSFHNNSIIFHKVPMLKCSFLVVQNSKLSFFLFFHQILITLAWWSTP